MLTQKTLDFLFENRLQNSKAWFEEHKSDYNNFVLAPLVELTIALTPTMLSIDDAFNCEPKVNKCISRIYRDTRFSKDKSLYRDVMWIVFMREKKLYNGVPGFFFELSPEKFRYGCGYYGADASSMEAIRTLILAGDKDFKNALAAAEKQTVFSMEGDMYKKSKYPDQPDSIKNWLDRKDICFIANSTDADLLFSDKLADRLAQDFKLLEPVYQFLMKAEISKRR